MNKSNGFTLVELVIVIVILGILSAVALPRFIDLRIDAIRASTSGIYGSFQAGILLAKAKCMATNAASSTLDMGGVAAVDLGLNCNAIPAANLYERVAQGLPSQITGILGVNVVTYTYTGTNCSFAYTYDNALSTNTPLFTPPTTGCSSI